MFLIRPEPIWFWNFEKSITLLMRSESWLILLMRWRSKFLLIMQEFSQFPIISNIHLKKYNRMFLMLKIFLTICSEILIWLIIVFHWLLFWMVFFWCFFLVTQWWEKDKEFRELYFSSVECLWASQFTPWECILPTLPPYTTFVTKLSIRTKNITYQRRELGYWSM